MQEPAGRIQTQVPANPLTGLRVFRPVNSEAPPPIPPPALRAPPDGRTPTPVEGPVKERPRDEWAARGGFLDVRIE